AQLDGRRRDLQRVRRRDDQAGAGGLLRPADRERRRRVGGRLPGRDRRRGRRRPGRQRVPLRTGRDRRRQARVGGGRIRGEVTSRPDRPRRGSTSRGLAILYIGMREQSRLFSLAMIGSLVFGALTVADAWILGWATDHVIAPSFDAGNLELGLAVTVVALFLGVAVLRALGIIARRLIGGIVYFRLLADYRRRVTRRYLELPMSWHHR